MSTVHVTTAILEDILDLPEDVHITGASFEADCVIFTLEGLETVDKELVDRRVVLHYKTDFVNTVPSKTLKGISASPEG